MKIPMFTKGSVKDSPKTWWRMEMFTSVETPHQYDVDGFLRKVGGVETIK